MPKSSRTGDTNSLAASILARHTGQAVPTGLSGPDADAPAADPRAVTVQLDGTTIALTLRSGVELRVPLGLVPELATDADPEALADVRIADDGERVRWPALGVEHSVPALLAAVLGLRTAHANGRRGGLKGGHARAAALSPEQRASSARKAAEARWAPRPAAPGAVELGRRGGEARKAALSPEKRSQIAKDAARKRWGDRTDGGVE
jgi:Protein of unknown function (DUF2442)